MGILLLLVGLLAFVSGGLKLRGRARTLVAPSRAAAVETAVGALTILASGVGLARVRPAAWLLVGVALGSVLLSSVLHTRRLRAHHRRRADSEEQRLREFMDASGP